MEKIAKDDATVMSDDDAKLIKLGYKPTLYRGLDSFMNFAFGFTEVAVLPSVCIMYGFGLGAGGPAGIVWGFAVQFLLVMVIAHCMAEICSAYPSAGSVYHWAAMLVPPEWAPIASYTCGWANFLGNAAGDASFANGFGSFLSAALVSSGYDAITPKGQVGTSIAFLLIWSFLNFFRIDRVGWVNNLAALVHTASIIITIVAVLAMPSKLSSGSFVFGGYYNDTGFESHSYVGALAITTALFTFAGYEASAHMAEETGNSDTSAPKGIIYTCLATGIGGVGLYLSLLFATTDIEAALNGTTGNAAADVFTLACGSTMGSALTWLVVINLFFAGVSSVAVTGRITYALTRDNAFPFSDVLQQVNSRFKSPINAIMFVFILDALIMLLPLNEEGGASAFYSIIGLCTVGFQVSYGFPILMKLIFQPKDFPVTKLSLGNYSNIMGIISVSWLFGTSCLFFLPTSYPVKADNMNWLVVVVAGVVFLASLNWIFNSRYHFKGPKRVNRQSTDPETPKADEDDVEGHFVPNKTTIAVQQFPAESSL